MVSQDLPSVWHPAAALGHSGVGGPHVGSVGPDLELTEVGEKLHLLLIPPEVEEEEPQASVQRGAGAEPPHSGKNGLQTHAPLMSRHDEAVLHSHEAPPQGFGQQSACGGRPTPMHIGAVPGQHNPAISEEQALLAALEEDEEDSEDASLLAVLTALLHAQHMLADDAELAEDELGTGVTMQFPV